MKTTQTWKICDCFDGLPEIPDKSVDMILTDLPYGITACSWDNTLKLDCLWAEYRRVIKNHAAIVLTGSQPFTSILVMSAPDLFKYEWIWHKNFSGGFATAKFQPMKYHESILVFYKNIGTYNPQFVEYADSVKKRFREGENVKGSLKITNKTHKGFGGEEHTISFERGKYPESVLDIKGVPNCNGLKYHPSQKPLELWEYLIKTYTNEGDMVHDSCLGSGTTLEACMNLNRNCIGFEIDPQWEPIYRKRLRLDNTKLDAFV